MRSSSAALCAAASLSATQRSIRPTTATSRLGTRLPGAWVCCRMPCRTLAAHAAQVAQDTVVWRSRRDKQQHLLDRAVLRVERGAVVDRGHHPRHRADELLGIPVARRKLGRAVRRDAIFRRCESELRDAVDAQASCQRIGAGRIQHVVLYVVQAARQLCR